MNIRAAAAAAAVTAALTGCSTPGTATAPATGTATAVVESESTGLLTDPLTELPPPGPQEIIVGHWAIQPPDRPAPLEETMIGGRYPITRLMEPAEAQTLKPDTPVCFWSRGREVARCAPLIKATADGAVVGPPEEGGGYTEGDVNARVFLVNDLGNVAALGSLTSIREDGGFGVTYLSPALAKLSWKLATAPEALWRR